MTDVIGNLFKKQFVKVQDVLVKKSPVERERLQKKAQQSLDKLLKDEKGMRKLIENMDAPATKSLIYANPPHKTSRKK